MKGGIFCKGSVDCVTFTHSFLLELVKLPSVICGMQGVAWSGGEEDGGVRYALLFLSDLTMDHVGGGLRLEFEGWVDVMGVRLIEKFSGGLQG